MNVVEKEVPDLEGLRETCVANKSAPLGCLYNSHCLETNFLHPWKAHEIFHTLKFLACSDRSTMLGFLNQYITYVISVIHCIMYGFVHVSVFCRHAKCRQYSVFLFCFVSYKTTETVSYP